MPEVNCKVKDFDFPVDFNSKVEHPKGGSVYKDAYRKGLQLDPVLTVAEWAEKTRVLPQKSSAEPGQWRNSRPPYLIQIQEELTPS